MIIELIIAIVVAVVLIAWLAPWWRGERDVWGDIAARERRMAGPRRATFAEWRYARKMAREAKRRRAKS